MDGETNYEVQIKVVVNCVIRMLGLHLKTWIKSIRLKI
jgi:hypothetical protein